MTRSVPAVYIVSYKDVSGVDRYVGAFLSLENARSLFRELALAGFCPVLARVRLVNAYGSK